MRKPLLLWNIPSWFKFACDLEMAYFALHVALLVLTQLLRISTLPSNYELIQESLYVINHILFLENQ